MNTREVTRQYRLNQWTEIIRQCRSSGQKISAWCAEHNINPKSYYYWLKRVRIAACESLPTLSPEQAQFVPIKMSGHRSAATPVVQGAVCPIVLRIGAVTLELQNGASTTLIETTLKALAHVR